MQHRISSRVARRSVRRRPARRAKISPAKILVRFAIVLCALWCGGALVRAITRTDATKPFYTEPTVFQNNETWNGVGQIVGGISPGSGALISPCHVLTAAHVFYGPDGIGEGLPDPKKFNFVLVTGTPAVNAGQVKGLKARKFAVADATPNPGYDPKVGHRIDPMNPKKPNEDLTRNDIAVMTLTKRVPKDIEAYAINENGIIANENDPDVKIPGNLPNNGAQFGTVPNAVKVGLGNGGNGVDGSVTERYKVDGEEVKLKREMFNIINSFGDGTTKFANINANRDNPPPKNTLLYDFDVVTPPEQAKKGVNFGFNSSKLTNTFNAKKAPNYSVGDLEGSAAGGDSGGPMFQYKDGKGRPFIVGVTSSGSDVSSRTGNVGYDTQVQKYAAWIKGYIKDHPCDKKDEGDEPPEKTEHNGGVETTLQNGTVLTAFDLSTDVYLSGGPQKKNDVGLPDGTYYFQVTDRQSDALLSTDIALCRQLVVSGGQIGGAVGPGCKHTNGTSASGAVPVQLFPFSPAPNTQNEYTVWLIPQDSDTTVSDADPRVLLFDESDARTADFTVQRAAPPPPPAGSCQASSSLTVLVAGTSVVGYVPKGNWSVTPTTGVSVVNIEGSTVVPTRISTPQVVNSCASNALTGETVCTANNTDVYVLTGTTLQSTLTSGGSGSIGFSGGTCTNCGITMDAIHNKAIIGLSVANAPGFQFLDLGTSSFEPPFVSPAGAISEAPVFDPSRNLLLSATENNKYEIVNVANTASPAFFENTVGATGFELDSSAEECTTGIALAPAEFSQPSAVFIADLTQASTVAGTPGTWTAPSQIQTLSESFLSAGATGIAVAQGTHTGIISGEFGGDSITAIQLPATSGSGTPAIADWVTCSIGNGFSNGFDPHTLTAYQSPNTGNAVAVLANGGATSVAIIDLTKMLDPSLVPRTGGGHACAAGTLPSSVANLVSVP